MLTRRFELHCPIEALKIDWKGEHYTGRVTSPDPDSALANGRQDIVKNLSQGDTRKEAGDRVGVSRSTTRRWAHGLFRPGRPAVGGRLRLGRPRWLAAAAEVALPLVGLTHDLSVAVPAISLDPTADPIPGIDLPDGPLGVVAMLALVLVTGVTVNAVFAFGEEFGWRGYLLWELAPLGFWKASLAMSAVWGLWHASVVGAGYNYPSFPIVGVTAMTVACIAFSPVYTYLVVRSESVLAAALLHGVFNGSGGLVIAYANTETAVLEELVASPVGAAGVAAFALAAGGIAVAGTPRLTRDFAGEPATGRSPAAADD